MNGSKTKNNDQDQDLLIDIMEDESSIDNEALYYT